ncbi:CHC2 zinc finger domain-containing protein [Sulfobacillus sp. hq2]|uniref:CHC2 zinc finger domain-containing protein n=1 Tax=Sulfobacillus sp. hq2 TaxID=2039167 RepID=UPI001304B022|nr:CHC2 zinc finger domain-containing protein [Sulfobacillus sp. hq2]
MKQTVRIEDVIGQVVPLTRHGAWYRGRCPFHADQHPSLVVWPATQTWKCMTCSPRRDDVIGFVARWHQVSTAEALRWLRTTYAPHGAIAPRPTPTPAAPARAPLAVRDATYRAWLAQQTLHPRHRHALHARGLPDRVIAQAGLVSHTPGLTAITPAQPGVPGFWHHQGHWHIAGPAGVIIPVRDVTGQIQALHVRADDPTRGKYRWLSSSGRPGGASSGAPVHVARGVDTVVWVTEGPLKALVAHARLQHTVLGIPGVQAWAPVPALITALGPQEVILAFDREPDPAKAALVRAHEDRLAHALRTAGWRVRRAQWTGAKGLDDALQAGCPVSFTPE